MSQFKDPSRRSLLKGLALAPAASALAGPALGQGTGGGAKVVFGIGLSSVYAQYVVCVEKGFTKKNGLAGEYKIFESGIGGIEAVVAGNAQVASGAELTSMRPRASGGNLVSVGRPMISMRDNAIAVRKGIETPADFKGKKFGLIRGSAADYFFYKFARKHGLESGTGPDKVELLTVQAPEWIPALQRGDIDGFFGWEPWVSRLPTIVRDAKVYAYSGDENLYPIWNCLLFREDWTRANADAAGATLVSLLETTEWMNASKDNMEEATRIVSRVFRVPLDAMRVQMAGITFQVDNRKEMLVRLKEVGEWAKSLGYLKVDDVDKLIAGLDYPDIAKKYTPQVSDRA